MVGVFASGYAVLHRPKPEPQLKTDLERRSFYDQLTGQLESKASRFYGDAGILVRDLETGDSVSINENKLFPSASLVKLPIMAAVFQANEEGKLRLTDELALKRSHKIRDCSRIYFMPVGTRLQVRDIIERMIDESDNTATNMIVDALGFGYINQKFLEFGLKDTDLRRGVMDLKWRRRGIENYTTPAEMGMLLEKIYHGQLVSPWASAEMLDILKRQKVNDRIPRRLPDSLDIAHKTGLLSGTVSDVGIVFAPESDFIICVLTNHIRDYRSAKRFISDVAFCTYQSYLSLNQEPQDADALVARNQ
jgi:beta-lactamase class A